MDDNIYLTILFDYYEELLDEKDRECFKSYYFDNLSLGEISSSMGISRNAIFKRLKKVSDELLNFENKLGLYEKEKKILSVISDDKLREMIKDILS